jgi:ABC-type multidrug transport system ATPase subunit
MSEGRQAARVAANDSDARVELRAVTKTYGPVRALVGVSARVRFDLGAFAERPFRTYSRGQRQRVALARALVHEPLLLLLDEPTTGLDAKSVESLQRVVRAEAERGAVVVVITHDEVFARAAGDVRVVLDRGRIRDDEATGASS